jgi:hypothetical protein
MGALARAKRHLVTGVDGARRLEIVRDGASLCAPSARETEFRNEPHPVAIVPPERSG